MAVASLEGAAARPRRFYTVAEVAVELGLSEPTVYRAIRAGEFPAIRVRGRYVVPAKAIDAMEEWAIASGLVDAADVTLQQSPAGR
ncbi:MAG: helix-turn-helix domain-containing protein [Natronosporangium sp.]